MSLRIYIKMKDGVGMGRGDLIGTWRPEFRIAVPY
jgi:hypothetical protein